MQRPPDHHPTDGDDRHGIQRMGGHRPTVGVAHHLGVAVIGRHDQQRARAVDGRSLENGVLADVAPTLLELAGLQAWPGITGRSLLRG